MDDIEIKIETSKTHYSDGCVETLGADEMDLLRGEPKSNSDETVSTIIM